MRLALVVGLWVGAWQLPAYAQAAPEEVPPAPAQTSPNTVPSAPAEPQVERIPLSLSEAIAIGIENNTDVQLVRYDPPIAEYDYQAAWGVHDPTLYSDYSYRSSKIPIASSFFEGQFIERDSLGDAGLQGLVPRLGWTYQLGYTGESLSTNSRVQTLGTTYSSNLSTSVTAPLLKGAWWGQAWTQVQVTGLESDVALEQFRQRLMDIIGGPPNVRLELKVEQSLGIENAYWTLAARQQEREVATKSLETARKLLDQAKAQYDVGVVSRVEVTEAEAGVADRDFRLITAENRYYSAQDDLIDRVYGPRLTPTSRLEIEPTDRPESYVTFVLNAEASTRRAFERRPELTIAQQRVEQNEMLLKFAKNERLPQVDLVGSYGTYGLSGKDAACSPFDPSCNPANPTPGIGDDYSDNTRFWFDGNDNRVWVAGAVFTLPIPNNTARANVSKRELELRRALTNVTRVEQDIVKQVRDAVRDLASALEGVEAADRGVAASTEQLRAERIRLEHGESTPFEVLLREEQLVTAESQRIAALRVYHGSVTSLDRAQGTLLEDRSIVLDQALPLR